MLELRQNQPNSGDGAATGSFSDYSSTFTNSSTASGANSLFVNDNGSATAPGLDNKYIAGHSGTTGTGDFMRSEERRVGKEGRSRWSPGH